ncbi:hypothetical protein [Thiomonas sp.]|uniref:hypothetical protein n=1 Tax=Thiomonas sp. TaxID=2047785 RepID=UPI002635868F|nr:hypothetical protein [Thiomonas sp.]
MDGETVPHRKWLVRGAAAIIVLTGATASAAPSATPVYLGVLEAPQTAPTRPHPPVSSTVHVRVVFRREGSAWKPMPSAFRTLAALRDASRDYPASVDWTVVYRGRAIGHVTSHDPGALHWYADVGTQIISTPATDIPVVRDGARNFSGAGTHARRRPLLLVSAPNAGDPQRWKSTVLTRAETAKAAAALRMRVPRSERCEAPEQGPVRAVPYGNDSIQVIRAYRDKDGEVLFGERLVDPRANCDYFDDPTFMDYWFVMHRQGPVRYLGRQMTPMEAADVDHSGTSAWIFFTSRGEDQSGYELFYDDFDKVASFEWVDH